MQVGDETLGIDKEAAWLVNPALELNISSAV